MYYDPSAGSPTETLLRLLLPLNKKIYCHFLYWLEILTFHLFIQSVGATGGVYKGQGLIQCKLMTCFYKEFLVQNK